MKTGKQELERLIDRDTLAGVLLSIVDVCNEKSTHIETEWQDTRLANVWLRAGRKVWRAADTSQVKAVSR